MARTFRFASEGHGARGMRMPYSLGNLRIGGGFPDGISISWGGRDELRLIRGFGRDDLAVVPV
jgi:hypothetical protein